MTYSFKLFHHGNTYYKVTAKEFSIKESKGIYRNLGKRSFRRRQIRMEVLDNNRIPATDGVTWSHPVSFRQSDNPTVEYFYFQSRDRN